MSIWTVNATPEQITASGANTMMPHLGIVVTEVGPDYIRGTMPVDHRTIQPFGLLHGGASVVLAETLGSIAGGMTVKMGEETVVGLEINANHVKSAKSGLVTGTARSIHIGRRTQIWEIRIENDNNELVCISRLTLAVIPLKKD